VAYARCGPSGAGGGRRYTGTSPDSSLANTMIRRLGTLALVAALAACWAGPAAAQWKWRGKNGTLHISDLPPPPEVADKDIVQRPREQLRREAANAAAATATAAASAASTSARARPATDPELEARLRRTEQERQDKQKHEEEKQAAQRAESCSRAREAMRTLDSGTRLVRVNDKGEREVLDDKQRAEETQRARNLISSECR
jgi:hypothetical protein